MSRAAREADWLAEAFISLPTIHERMLPSEWAEQKRYLPPHVTSLPGYYRFGVAPYLREILDCLGPQSNVTHVDFMKGVQIGATVGLLENCIGYFIEHVKDAPMLMVTTDVDLANVRVQKYILPMLEHSELSHLVQSNDAFNKRKRGVKEGSIEWQGGGFLLTFGANSPGKLRSTSIRVLLLDEIDSYKDRVGKDGKPETLAEDRTVTFGGAKKILKISTPLIKQTSKIHAGFLSGDRRRYFVPCKGCGKHQFLRWSGTNEDGTVYGMVWKTSDKGSLIPGSVRYVCKYCQFEHRHVDASWWYRDGGRYCYWEPTAEPDFPEHRSYHAPAFYSTRETWEEQVKKWLKAYDVENNRVKDTEAMQQFYNNVLGEPFEVKGESLDKRRVQMHRRNYHHKMVPNLLSIEETGHPIYAIIMSVDVHKEHLDVLVMGYTYNRVGYGIEHRVIEGNCETLDKEPWQELQKMVELNRYRSDDGKEYPIALTLIDASYNADLAYGFSSDYASSVFPIMGRRAPQKNASIKEFQPFESKLGTTGYNIVVDIYKDRYANALRRERPEEGYLPLNHVSFPFEFTDRFFDELCKEYKREVINEKTGQRMGFEWHRPGGGNAPNEAWDLLVYCGAGFDMIVADTCLRLLELEEIRWDAAYQELAQGMFFIETG